MKKQVVAHKVQLLDVFIEKINCQRVADFQSGIPYDVVFSVKAKTINNNLAYGYFRIKILFNKEPKIFNLDITVRGEFKCEKTTNRTELKRFVEQQGLPLLLPWARQAVASLTLSMGLPPLLLPLIDVFATIRSNEPVKEESKGSKG
ncbi:Preprotein translocase subunit SecB [Desulforamulus putei DSM 12395]|uniref:Preprotein translocase subunit SecB n=1 Tax=Desulforamulus putei DSM 12395 TaxID=1121429 RepID=A0A1M4SGA4_9FIRM|nr:protein-export chaperone SecB [Desulforamulus putei]SHE31263.1 Preprotein translocase subunit SecB [Desulforamulus putei DSM 12395]